MYFTGVSHTMRERPVEEKFEEFGVDVINIITIIIIIRIFFFPVKSSRNTFNVFVGINVKK